MRVAIVGGSAAGLALGLLLARAGHRAVVVERDALETALGPEEQAVSAFRVGAPQVVQAHVFQSLARNLLRAYLPDVYAQLLGLGAVERSLVDRMPPTVRDRTARPGDDELAIVHARRSTLDRVLQQAAAAQAGLELSHGEPATGLLAEPGDPPLVRGLRTSRRDLPADLVVDAAGRRSPIDRWLASIGAQPTVVERRDCGVAYYTRFYRRSRSTDAGGVPGVLGGPLPWFTALVFPAENGVVQLALAPLAEDTPLRHLRDAEVFENVARTVPVVDGVLDSAEPISPVYPMGGLHNTYRRLVSGRRPVARGLLAVGDSVCTTNPTFGRGVSMALRTVIDTAELIEATPKGPDELVNQADARATARVRPWFDQQAEIDEARLADLRARIHGTPDPAPPRPEPGTVGFAALNRAAGVNPIAFRARCRLMGMIEAPASVLTDPTVVEAVRDTTSPPPHPGGSEPGPTREQLLQLVGANTARAPE